MNKSLFYFSEDFNHIQMLFQYLDFHIQIENPLSVWEEIEQFISIIQNQMQNYSTFNKIHFLKVFTKIHELEKENIDNKDVFDIFVQVIDIIISNEEIQNDPDIKSLIADYLVHLGITKFLAKDNHNSRILLFEAFSLCKDNEKNEDYPLLFTIGLILYISGLIEKSDGNPDKAYFFFKNSVNLLQSIDEIDDWRVIFLIPDVLASLSILEKRRHNLKDAIEYQIESVLSQKKVVQKCDALPDFKIKLAKKMRSLANLYSRENNEKNEVFLLYQGIQYIQKSHLKTKEVRRLHKEILSDIFNIYKRKNDLNSRVSLSRPHLELIIELCEKDNLPEKSLYIDIFLDFAYFEITSGSSQNAETYIQKAFNLLNNSKNKIFLKKYLKISDIASEISQIEQKNKDFIKSIYFLEMGIQCLETILDLHPNSPQCRYNLVHMYHQLGLLYEASHEEDRVLETFIRASRKFLDLPGCTIEMLLIHCHILRKIGRISIKTQNFILANKILNQNLAICREGYVRNSMYFSFELGITLTEMGILKEKLSNSQMAELFYLDSLQYLQYTTKQNQWYAEHFRAEVYNRLGIIERSKNNYNRAIDYFDQSVFLIKQLRNSVENKDEYFQKHAEVARNIAETFQLIKQNQLSIDNFYHALSLLQEMDFCDDNHELQKVEILQSIGSLKIEFDEIIIARNLLLQALDICRNGSGKDIDKYRHHLILVLRDLGNLELKNNDPDQAEIFANEAYHYIINDKTNVTDELFIKHNDEILELFKNIENKRSSACL